jgi:hypothetical protein
MRRLLSRGVAVFAVGLCTQCAAQFLKVSADAFRRRRQHRRGSRACVGINAMIGDSSLQIYDAMAAASTARGLSPQVPGGMSRFRPPARAGEASIRPSAAGLETGAGLLAIPASFTHNSQNQRFGGNHACPAREISARLDARHGARGFDVADHGPGLYPRRAGGLQRRCFSALQRGYTGCRPRHGLHGQEQGPALAGLSGLFQRPRACRRAGQGRGAAQNQAGDLAKARRLQAAQTQRRIARRDHGPGSRAPWTRFVRQAFRFSRKADGADARIGRITFGASEDRAQSRPSASSLFDFRLCCGA